ncbi:N-acyl homoserine lactonase family protein [Tardiphaga sp.]|uniref:N-acyl homoserine lactonase family protein n=1 Tax=Tardiphaga sp. TaxID=1926292 RepID=UPI0025FA5895|nr:N-acyl homoserine lactonase family protein [Tardiphaga sp.]
MDDTTYEVYAIRFATNTARLRGQNFISDANPLQPHTMDFFCWLLVGGRRAIMVDTGTSQTVIERQNLQFLRCPTEALTALGFDAAAVETVILTHLHYDHIGNLDKFPAARFYVPKIEMQYATGPDMQYYFLRRPYGPKEINSVIDLLYQERVIVHGPVLDLMPGISLHHVGGHTAGQEIVRVRTQRGWLVLASDALHYYEELERTIPFAVAHDISRMLAAHATIRELADSDDHIVPAHDPLVMSRYRAPRADLEGFVVRLDLPPQAHGG